jgi:CRISPR-associated protein (TIGR03986 family)
MVLKHLSNVPENRKAIAPYNFVELPEKFIEARLPLPEGDRYHSDRHTGKIQCTLMTESPLYIRCGLTLEEFNDGKEAKDLPEFFYTNSAKKSTKPVIPGSSLRGMLRALLEIVSFSKIERVTKNKLFYRSLGDPALKDIYTSNFVEEIPQVQHPPHPKAPCYATKVRAGFLHRLNNSYVIEECHFGRIDRSSLNGILPNTSGNPNAPTKPLYKGSGPGRIPIWDYQNKIIYVKTDHQEKDYFFPKQFNQNNQRHPDLYLRYRKVHTASFEKFDGCQVGTLVITGDMQHKHLEFVFLHENFDKYPVSEEMIRHFQDNDQITKWQADAFKKDKPTLNCRQKDGYLRDKDPVFFLLNDDGTVRFLGRAQMFRLPYDLSPRDLIPKTLQDQSKTDIAEAIFGYVDGKAPRDPSRAGRIFFENAHCTSTENIWWKGNFEQTITPKILASPKATTFQHYLVETSTERNKLRHYSPKPNEEQTTIRGHKLYWHKGHEPVIELATEASDSQKTQIKPINRGVSFKFDIHFENLNDVEFGALLWVLSLSSDKAQSLGIGKAGEQYCFSLGMGKPLGMGSIKIDYKILLSNREHRYRLLFDESSWNIAESNSSIETIKDHIKIFENFILDPETGIDRNDDPNVAMAEHLAEIPRIQTLLAMLCCDSPSSQETEYMGLDQFRSRPVLPTPLQIKLESGHKTDPLKQGDLSSSNRTSDSSKAEKPAPPKKRRS